MLDGERIGELGCAGLDEVGEDGFHGIFGFLVHESGESFWG